jgi:hypothetical protein
MPMDEVSRGRTVWEAYYLIIIFNMVIFQYPMAFVIDYIMFLRYSNVKIHLTTLLAYTILYPKMGCGAH